jgi:hypothetical protein
VKTANPAVAAAAASVDPTKARRESGYLVTDASR